MFSKSEYYMEAQVLFKIFMFYMGWVAVFTYYVRLESPNPHCELLICVYL